MPLTITLWIRHNIRWLLPLCLAIAIKCMAYNSVWVERWYSDVIFYKLTMPIRFVLSQVPFSIGDCVYAFMLTISLFYTFRFVWKGRRDLIRISFYQKIFVALSPKLLWLYVVFNLLWGLNYNRVGIAQQLNVSNRPYSFAQLTSINCFFLEQMNENRSLIGDSIVQYPPIDTLFEWSVRAYAECSKNMRFLKFPNLFIKKSLLTKVVSYAGYSGYYNPFTTETQVNTDLPPFLLPFVCTHELAHQMGYASESEANFIAYLVCSQSSNPFLRYSSYFEMYLTANSELYRVDYCAARVNTRAYHPWVKEDIKTYKNFVFGKQNRVEPVAKWVYDNYLKANQQIKGIDSYDDVIAWIINYHLYVH